MTIIDAHTLGERSSSCLDGKFATACLDEPHIARRRDPAERCHDGCGDAVQPGRNSFEDGFERHRLPALRPAAGEVPSTSSRHDNVRYGSASLSTSRITTSEFICVPLSNWIRTFTRIALLLSVVAKLCAGPSSAVIAGTSGRDAWRCARTA